jgi:hypothetical protein
VSIAQQIATPNPASRTRRSSTPLQAVESARPLYALVRLLALISVTAFGAAFVVGTIVIAVMMVASNLGG